MTEQRRAIIVLGASGGIGTAMCSYIAKKTDNIKLYALQRKKEITVNSKINIVHFDLLVPTFEILKKKMQDDFQKTIDEIVLVLTAGTISPIDKLVNIEEEEYRKNIKTNIEGQIYLISHLINEAKKTNTRIRIISMDSGAAYQPIKGWGLYCCAKAYISMYLRVLSEENPSYKIVMVDPGVVDTRMQEEIRTASDIVFPRKKEFVGYKTDNILRNPDIVAKEIADRYIFDWKAEGIMERLE